MEYDVIQKLKEEDYIAYVNHQLLSYFFRPLNIVMYGLIIAYAVYSIIATQNLFVLVILGALGLLNYFMIYTTRRRAKKFYNQNQDLIGMELTFKEDNLVYKNTDGELTKFWYEFTGAKETEKYIYLTLRGQGGLIIVKETAGTDAITFLKEKIKQHINPKKVSNPPINFTGT